MKILFISASDKNYDGRTRALLDALYCVGNVVEITVSEENKNYGNEYYIKKGSYVSFINRSVILGKTIKNIDCLFIDNRKASIPGLILKKLIHPKVTFYDARELYLKNEVIAIKSKLGCISEKKVIEEADYVVCANCERKKIMEDIYALKNDILVFENYRELHYSTIVDVKKLENPIYRKRFTLSFYQTYCFSFCFFSDLQS